MLPGFDATPLKREFKRLMIRSVSPIMGAFLNTSTAAAARQALGLVIGSDVAAAGAIGSSGLTMATSRLLGRTTASTGAVEELNANQVRTHLLQLPPVRQTVLNGPVDSSGYSAFGGSTGSTTVTASGTLTPTTANGISGDRIGSITNPSWTGLSTNGTMYLYLDIAEAGTCTPGSTTLAPAYQWGGTYSTTSGQFTFNAQEMTGKVGDGAAAAQTHRVFVGEVTVAGNVVTAITWYALMGRYESAASGLTFGANTSYNHNIGTTLVDVDGLLVCTTTDIGYSVGDEAHNWADDTTSNYGATMTNTSGNSAVFSINSGGPLLTNRSTFATSNITAASWSKKIIVRRRF